jgi:Na+/melibiose symporter-like transporter
MRRVFRLFLLRNSVFGVLIGAIPALLPVVGLKALHLDAVHLGLVFTSLGLGSLAGAILILQPARKRLRPNQMTLLGGVALAVVYALMAFVRHPQAFFAVAALAGAAWTISASELWVAGQRVIPDWIRGRMNATHMMSRKAAWLWPDCFGARWQRA